VFLSADFVLVVVAPLAKHSDEESQKGILIK